LVVLLLVAIFKSSSALAAAYGVAVTATMISTSLMASVVLRWRWMWPMWRVTALLVPLLVIEFIFFSANVIKIVEGAWVPIAVALSLVIAILTWRRGTHLLVAEAGKLADLHSLVQMLEKKPPLRVSGTAVFLTATPDAAPSSLAAQPQAQPYAA
jgi:KUP system potassium uptake protein